MSTEEFSTSSGKTITAHIGESGEPEKVSWTGDPELSENEVYEICQFFDEFGVQGDSEDSEDTTETQEIEA